MAQNRNDLFAGYLEEVQTYIPIIHQRIEELREDPRHPESFTELYRLVHIIKGASSMVGIQGLSRMAGYMESVLDEIQEGRASLSPAALEAMQSTTLLFGQYCQGLQEGTSLDDAQLLAQTEKNFAGIGVEEHESMFSLGMDDLIDADDLLATDPETSASEMSLLDEFQAEAEQHLEVLEQAIGTLHATVTRPTAVDESVRAPLNAIRRSVHTLKGASAVIGLPDISAYAHLVEDVMDWFCESAATIDPQQISLLSASIDALARLIIEPSTFDEQYAEEILGQLSLCMVAGTGQQQFSPETPTVTPENEKQPSPPRAAAPAPSQATNLFSDEELLMLRDGFREEAEEHLQQLHQSMERLEREIHAASEISAGHREEIRTIRRSVHTIKGASSVIGLQDIAGYAHGVEDFLDWLFEGARFIDPAMLNTLAEALDLLGLLVETPEQVLPGRLESIHQRLDVLIEEKPQPEPEPISPESPEQSGMESSRSLPLSETLTPVDQESVPDQATTVTAPAETAKTIRINQAQLDTLINLTNELLVGVSGFDRDMEQFSNALNELDLTTRRLKDIALELETKFEVKALDRLSERFTHLNETFTRIKTGQSFAEFDALELDRYTQLNLIIRSLNESTIDVAAIHSNLGGIFSGIGGDINRQHRVIRELQVHMMRARMSPMSSLSSRLHRTVRDVASRLGKPVRLVMEGEWVELDRTVWEKLADPLMHLIRNAVHHGVETKERRLALNKPATATITLSARREGNHIVLRFGDDGQGLDFEAIRAKARKFGLGAQVEQMDERQLVELIFYPGFSTKTISEISGRGVGMDVVKESVKELQGSIITETRQGKGTTFVLRIPLTLGILRALLVKAGGITYGIPLNDIHDIQRLDSRDVFPESGSCTIAGATVDLHALSALLGVQEEPGTNPATPLVLTIKSGGQMVALSIPPITGQKEIVVKGLGSHLKTVPGVSGAAVMGDGSIVPVLDIPDLIQASKQESVVHSTFFQQQPVEDQVKTILIVDDSISIRRVMSRLVIASGWAPVEAKDGQDALGQLESMTQKPDCILLDIEMPNMNGFEFLAKLPNIAGGDSIPVIMLTSRTSGKHREKAFQLGAKAFLNKPCKDEEFVDTVTRLTQSPLRDEVAI